MIEEQFFYIPSTSGKLAAFVGLTDTNRTAPPVILCHGFTGTKTEKCRHLYRFAQKLAERGLLPVRFDFTGFGDSASHSTAFTLSQAVEDILAVVSFMKENMFGDVSRLGILGFSLGGLIVARALAEGLQAQRACLVAAVEHYMLGTSEQQGLDTLPGKTFWYKGYELSLHFLKELLASKGARYIAELDIPIQLINAADDTTVDRRHYAAYCDALNARSPQPVLIDGANHGFMDKIFQDQLDDAVVRFFAR